MHQRPKSTIEAVCTRVRGIHHAAVPCQLPHDKKQVSVIAAKQNETKYKGSSVELADLFVVMQHADAEDLASHFNRSIKATDAAIVIANDIQIAHMVRSRVHNIVGGKSV